MMNEANRISNKTRLYGYIAADAGQNRFSAALNRLFRAGGDDAMMIPMNIREDDFYFTLSNMKKSHVNGAVIGAEYQKEAVGILDVPSPLVQENGFCDIVTVREGRLYGDIIAPSSLRQCHDENGSEYVVYEAIQLNIVQEAYNFIKEIHEST
jgi:shikimate 5-dehydrogenase